MEEPESDSSAEFEEHLKLIEILHDSDEDNNVPSTSYDPGPSTSKGNKESTDQELVNVEKALSLNKQLEDKYKLLESLLTERLKECRDKLKANSAAPEPPTPSRFGSFRYYMCGKPYFKDKQGCSPPDNEDTIIMRNTNMFDYSTVLTFPGWTVRDKSRLLTTLLQMSRGIKIDQLETQLHRLTNKKDEASKNQLIAIQNQMKEVQKKTLTELALPIEEDYDWEEVANELERRHKPQEYRSLWRLFFHPSINKDKWSKAEHKKLQDIAQANNFEDWDKIAKELKTNRTGYQCFVYFRTNMTDSVSNRRWSKEEMEYLKRLIDYYKEGNYIPWGKVATAMENRTKIQVYNKYMRMIEHRKGRFLTEEDTVILSFVEAHGQDFKRMSNYLPGRSSVQLRTRYRLLSKVKKSTTWTVEDDKKLIEIMSNQDNNTNYSTATKHFQDKDRMNIRSRYITLQRWIKTNPQCDIALAPRRGPRRLIRGKGNPNLLKAIENLKFRIQGEVSQKKLEQDNDDDVDDEIIAVMYQEMTQNKPKVVTETEKRSVVPNETININNLTNVLLHLNSKLNREEFLKSVYNVMYPNLGKSESQHPATVVKVKSYSKKERIRSIAVDKRPNIWGDRTIGPHDYVFPPNHETMIGCKEIMEAVKKADPNETPNISEMLEKNESMKKALELLKVRFNKLFTWPILLSSIKSAKANDDVEPNYSIQVNTLSDAEQTIPHDDQSRDSQMFEDINQPGPSNRTEIKIVKNVVEEIYSSDDED